MRGALTAFPTTSLPWLRIGTAQQLRNPIWQRTTARQRSQRTMASGAAASPVAAATKGARTALDEMAASGEFVRKESTYRQWVKKGTGLKPEGGAVGAAGGRRAGTDRVRSAGEGMT
jgi:hypothetical protein